jgi:hypothetical protein
MIGYGSCGGSQYLRRIANGPSEEARTVRHVVEPLGAFEPERYPLILAHGRQ